MVLFVSRVAGQVDSRGYKVFIVVWPGRISISDLAAALAMRWGWTWCRKGFRTSWISFKVISLTWMLLASLVSSLHFATIVAQNFQFSGQWNWFKPTVLVYSTDFDFFKKSQLTQLEKHIPSSPFPHCLLEVLELVAPQLWTSFPSWWYFNIINMALVSIFWWS